MRHSVEVKADSGRSDSNGGLIIGRGQTLALQKRPRRDLALLLVDGGFLK